MKISFKSANLIKVFNSEKLLKKEYGQENAKYIMRHMAILKAADSLSQVPHTPPTRRHELTGSYKDKFAVDLKHPFRLVFEPNHENIPRKEDGGIDLEKVTAIKILKVEDYH